MEKPDLSLIVVDDMESARQVVAAALRNAGYEDIRTAGDGREVLEMLKERRADVVLADWIMPEMDGLTLTDSIRQLDEELNRYTAILLFTAKEGIEHLVEAFNRGVDDYLTKPLNHDELAARVYAAGRITLLQNTLFETSTAMEEQNQQLHEMAYTDPLTGLGNRRYLMNHLEAALEETVHRGGATCYAIIDLDHFKEINDTHGHDVGDEVLTGFANRLRRSIRPTDILARIGGEEFALIFHYPDVGNFKHSIFMRIQQTISTRPLKTSVGNIEITASMGVCCRFTKDAPMTIDILTKCADQKLYRAKEKGRNQVIY